MSKKSDQLDQANIQWHKNELKRYENVPDYYVGDTHREGYYQARYVVEDFNCTWNIGNVVTYCLRSSRKHESPIECLQKSINHLKFEIERLEKLNKNKKK